MKKFLVPFFIVFIVTILCVTCFAAEDINDKNYDNVFNSFALADPTGSRGFASRYVDYWDQPECGVYRFFRDEFVDMSYQSYPNITTLGNLVSGVSDGTLLYFYGFQVKIRDSSNNWVVTDSVPYSYSTQIQIVEEYYFGVWTVRYPVISSTELDGDRTYANWLTGQNYQNATAPVFEGNFKESFVYTAYKGSNLLPYPFYSSSHGNVTVVGDVFSYYENGVTLEYNTTTGYFRIFGTNTGTSNFTFRFVYQDSDPLMLPYSWSVNIPQFQFVHGGTPFFNFRFKQPDGSYTNVDGVRSDRSFVGGEFSHLVRFTLVIPIGSEVDLTGIGLYDISFNIGSTVLPFQPYMPDLLDKAYQDGYQAGDPDQAYQNGFNAGYDAGYDEGFDAGFDKSDEAYQVGYDRGFDDGYNSGYVDGYDKGFGLYEDAYQDGYQSGTQSVLDSLEAYNPDYFSYADIRYYYTTNHGVGGYNSLPITSDSISVIFDDRGFSFSASQLLYNSLFDPDRPDENPENTYIESSYIRIIFDSAHTPMYREDSFFLSSSLGFTLVEFIDLSGRIYVGYVTVDPSLGNKLVINGVAEPVYISEIILHFDNLLFNYVSDNVDFSVYSNSVTYINGYRDGYADCLGDNGSDYADLAYRDGYQVGYNKGKVDGIGISEVGTFNSLILSVVQAPVDVFMSLLNFDLLGVNMLAFAGSILSICLIGFIIRKFLL